MSVLENLTTAAPVRPPSVADQVFDALYNDVVTLALAPGARLSEADVAKAMGVSRQPVRDAFWRLSQRGFVTIRPQRATTISPISVRAVQQARFIRTALEVEALRVAAERLAPSDLAELARNLDRQAEAVAARDHPGFQVLDDAFHQRICELAGVGFVWGLIRENKAHMDRVRYLSLSTGADRALADHRRILAALEAQDAEAAVGQMRTHLSHIVETIAHIRESHAGYFADEA